MVSVSIGQALDIERKVADDTLNFALVEGMVSFPNITEDMLIAVAGKEYQVEENLSLHELMKHSLCS